MAVCTLALFVAIFVFVGRTIGIAVSPQYRRDLELVLMRAAGLVGGMWAGGRVIGRLAQPGTRQTFLSAAIFELGVVLTPMWWSGARDIGFLILLLALPGGIGVAHWGARQENRS